MTTLYVTEAGTQVRKVDERLVVYKDQQVVDEIPMIKVDQVVMVGRGVSLTTPALFELTKRGVDVVYLSGSGRYVSRLVGGEHKHGKLRYTQALATADPRRVLTLAKNIVRGKIANQRTLVRRHSEGAPWAQQALAGMDAMAQRLEANHTLDEVRGMEGQAAKEYFSLLRRLLANPINRGSWGFERRVYYPPTDPVNAMLSFGYTLLLNDMTTACQLTGLDPYLGCFHAIDYGRPSMALDLIEEFRPIIVDSIVLTAVNRFWIRLEDFGNHKIARSGEEIDLPSPDGQAAPAVYMSAEARKKFLGWYEDRVNEQITYPITQERTTYRRIFSLQAQLMAKVILGQSQDYKPLIVK